ncbi:MAG TPA: proteasome accessory factor PafA2 family protein [Patescibacteria group bacterium]|nr:proteasome accessory factor PafA2 family protein [Patescibacteria group bacterium]
MSETSAKEFYPYPVAFGNEEETSLRFFPGQAFEPAVLKQYLSTYRRDMMELGIAYWDRHDSTGGAIYIDNRHLEIASPECPTIEELVARMQSNEDVLVDITSATLSRSRRPRAVGINRRVVDNKPGPDGIATTFGCHDNFGFIQPNKDELIARARTTLIGHLLTRPFVTGAGYNHPNGPMFSQKNNGLHIESEYGHKNSMYRVVQNEGTLRAEVRCNDVNISPWAAYERLGSSAIALAIGQTPLARRFDGFAQKYLGSLGDSSARFNAIPINPDGTFKPSADLAAAIGYQMRMAEIFLSNDMSNYGMQPPELIVAAVELYQYCEAMQKVLSGDLPYTDLADRADWAAKTQITLARIGRDEKAGDVRALTDEQSASDDLAYDFIKVSTKGRRTNANGEVVVAKSGYGYVLRDRKHRFRMAPSAEAVKHAKHHPPRRGRAWARTQLMQRYETTGGDWYYADLVSKEPDRTLVRIMLNDVESSRPPRVQRRKLIGVRPRFERKVEQ